PRATVVAIAPVDQRKLHVLDGVEARQQVEGLEHEADVLVADRRELVVGELSHVLPGEHVRAGIGYVEATEDVHERRLARARGTHDRDELARSDVEIDAPERVHRDLSTDRVGLCDAAELDDALDHRPMNTGTPCWIVATGSTDVTFPVMRVVEPTASTVTFATWPSLSLATSASPIVPCSDSAAVFARTANGLAELSPTEFAIDAITPDDGAVSVAASMFACAFWTDVAALSTEVFAL